MDSIPEAPLEALAVEKRHEELEVLFLAVVRGRRHQEEVAGQAREELPQAVALGVLDLASEEGRGELVGFVADDEVPAGVGCGDLGLDVLVAGELVEAGDDKVILEKPVAGAGGLELVVGEDLEGKVEAKVELVLPLLGEASRADHEAALEVAPRDELFNKEARHYGLPCPGVVGEEKAQRLAREHRLVDGRDLVWEGLDERGVDREHGVEKVREPDAVRFGDQSKEGPPLRPFGASARQARPPSSSHCMWAPEIAHARRLAPP